MTTSEMHAALTAPFREADVEFRVDRCDESAKGIWCTVFAYVTNRAIQERLDQVFGTTGWSNSFEYVNGGWLCTIAVYDRDIKQWVSKCDGAPPTSFEAFKGGLSDSMKRCACQFGIGRYLYKLPTMFATITNYDTAKSQGGKHGKLKNGKSFWWLPPAMPLWALPKDTTVPPNAAVAPTAEPGPDSDTIMDVAVRCFTDPSIPPDMKPFDYYQTIKKRMEVHRKSGTLSPDDYEILMNTYYWPTMEKEFPEWYSTEKQAQETFV